MTEQEREERLKVVAEWNNKIEENKKMSKEYTEEYYRKLRNGEIKLYTDEYLQKEAENL